MTATVNSKMLAIDRIFNITELLLGVKIYNPQDSS